MLRKGLFCLLLLCCVGSVVSAQQTITRSFYFDTDSSSLKISEKDKFNHFLKQLDSFKINAVSIYGYTDDRGRKGYNDTLSNKRAQFIKNLLLSYEVDNTIIHITAGRGKLPLENRSKIADQREENRRVELVMDYTHKPKEQLKPILNLDTLKVGDKLVLENILFETSRHQFLPESYKTLEILAATLKAKPQYNIAILGHICCNPPGRDIRDFDTGEYNLSFARARVVYEYLVKNGINPQRLTYKGMMANFPLGKGDKLDRRVELQVTAINP